MWRWVAAGMAVISTLVMFFMRWIAGEPTLGGSEMEALWTRGAYAQIAKSRAPWDNRAATWIAATIKAGNYEKGVAQLEKMSVVWNTERLREFSKALILREKGDLKGADKVMEQMWPQEKSVASLVAAIRAQWMCDQKIRSDCKTFAERSVELDLLAPYGMLLNAWVLRVQRDFKGASALYARAAALSGAENNRVRFNRGVTSFYMRQFSWAIEDLSRVVDDSTYGYEAKIFLWRSYLDSGKYADAAETFQKAFAQQWTEKRDSALWMGRVEMAQKNWTGALERYRKWYDKFPTALELVTDMVVPAARLGDTELVAELEKTILKEVKTVVSSYEIAGRKLREAGEYDAAHVVLEQWMKYASGDVQTKQLTTQLQLTIFAQAFALIQEWRSIYPMVAQLQKLDANPEQIAFLQWLAMLRAGEPSSAATLFAKIPTLANKQDQAYIWVRYNLFVGNIEMAQEVLDAVHASLLSEAQWSVSSLWWASGRGIMGTDNFKIPWLNRALARVQDNGEEAKKHLDALFSWWYISDENPWAEDGSLTEKELWRLAFDAFKPWVWWMTIFFDEEWS